jgi:hypothetical protein
VLYQEQSGELKYFSKRNGHGTGTINRPMCRDMESVFFENLRRYEELLYYIIPFALIELGND